MGDAAPVEDAVTAAMVTDGVYEETKGSKPGGGEDEIHRPVNKATSERE